MFADTIAQVAQPMLLKWARSLGQSCHKERQLYTACVSCVEVSITVAEGSPMRGSLIKVSSVHSIEIHVNLEIPV